MVCLMSVIKHVHTRHFLLLTLMARWASIASPGFVVIAEGTKVGQSRFRLLPVRTKMLSVFFSIYISYIINTYNFKISMPSFNGCLRIVGRVYSGGSPL